MNVVAALRALGNDMADEQDVFDDDVTETTDTEDTTDESETKVEAKAEKSEKVEQDQVTTTSKEVAGLRAALTAERGKRQEAEAKVRQQDAVKDVVPDPITEPEAYNSFLQDKGSARELRSRIAFTQDLMRDMHKDYEDMEKIFMGLVSSESDGVLTITDRALLDKFNASANPAKFAYNHSKEHVANLYKKSPQYEIDMEAKHLKKFNELLKSQGLSALDLPDFTNVSASESNTEESVKDSGDRIDAFD